MPLLFYTLFTVPEYLLAVVDWERSSFMHQRSGQTKNRLHIRICDVTEKLGLIRSGLSFKWISKNDPGGMAFQTCCRPLRPIAVPSWFVQAHARIVAKVPFPSLWIQGTISNCARIVVFCFTGVNPRSELSIWQSSWGFFLRAKLPYFTVVQITGDFHRFMPGFFAFRYGIPVGQLDALF